jgi:hypothetical protein
VSGATQSLEEIAEYMKRASHERILAGYPREKERADRTEAFMDAARRAGLNRRERRRAHARLL